MCPDGGPSTRNIGGLGRVWPRPRGPRYTLDLKLSIPRRHANTWLPFGSYEHIYIFNSSPDPPDPPTSARNGGNWRPWTPQNSPTVEPRMKSTKYRPKVSQAESKISDAKQTAATNNMQHLTCATLVSGWGSEYQEHRWAWSGLAPSQGASVHPGLEVVHPQAPCEYVAALWKL